MNGNISKKQACQKRIRHTQLDVKITAFAVRAQSREHGVSFAMNFGKVTDYSLQPERKHNAFSV